MGSIFRRVYLYQADHGLTRIRIYGIVFVSYLLFLLLSLLIRFAKNHKKPWYLLEVGAGVLLLVATIWWKPDYQIATAYQPTVNNEIDYVYITRLSADALPGWVESYHHAQKVWQETPVSTESATPESIRNVEYAYRSTQQLQTNYAHLVLRYGTVEEYAQLYEFTQNNQIKTSSYYELAKKHFDTHSQGGTLELNQAEKEAYELIKKEIDAVKLRTLVIDLKNYLDSIPTNQRPVRLDRSFDSPLL